MAPGRAPKRKSLALGPSEKPTQKQAVLSFGNRVGLSERPANVGVPSPGATAAAFAAQPEDSIKWHFCDPKKVTKAGTAVGQHAQEGVGDRQARVKELPAEKSTCSSSSSDRQLNAVLNLMNRGKQRRQHTTAKSPAGRPTTPSSSSAARGFSSLLGSLQREPKSVSLSRLPVEKSSSTDGSATDLLASILDDLARSTPKDLADAANAQPPQAAHQRPLKAMQLPIEQEDTTVSKVDRSVSKAVVVHESEDSNTAAKARPLLLEALSGARGPIQSKLANALRKSDECTVESIRDKGHSQCNVNVTASEEKHVSLRPYPPVLTGAVILDVQHRQDGLWLVLDPEEAIKRPVSDESVSLGLHLHLRDEWESTPARVGDRVHIVGRLQGCGCSGRLHQACGTLSRWCGALLILRPETFVTGTQVASACTCPRKATLSRMRKGGMDATAQLVLGSMKHELFEHLLHQRRVSAASDSLGEAPVPTLNTVPSDALGVSPRLSGKDSMVRSVFRAHLPDLLALTHDDGAAISELRQAHDVMLSWIRDFVPGCQENIARSATCPIGGVSSPERGCAVALDEHGGQLRRAMAGFDGDPVTAEARGLPHEVRLRGVSRTEFNVTSFAYGLKGTIDAVVDGELLCADGSKVSRLALPFELKTGKRTSVGLVDHQAQLLVYTLLLSEHNQAHVPVGLLFYSQFAGAERRGVSAVHADPAMLESLVMQRNVLAAGCAPHAIEDGRMPPMLGDSRMCGGCFERQHCFVTHAALESGDAQTSGVAEIFHREVGHLTPLHLSYARHWFKLIMIEQSGAERNHSIRFVSRGDHANTDGWSLTGMRVANLSAPIGRDESVNRGTARSPILHHFRKADGGELETKLNCGDMVSVSLMGSADGRVRARWGLATGIIKTIDAVEVTVQLQDRLEHVDEARLLRLDKEEIMTSFGTCRNNILSLLSPHVVDDTGGLNAKPSSLLRMIVDLATPRFLSPDEVLAGLPAETLCGLQELNVDQRDAVIQVLCAQDYSLIIGMPGTGKTTVIAHLVSAIVSLGQTVLISAYTHSALDNILLKLREMGVPLLRLGGAQGRVHPKLQADCIDNLVEQATDTRDLARLLSDRRVVATSSLSLGHVLLSKRTFDVCIIDEAGQVTEPVCIGPMRFADRFVLVGDHYQLPPLVTEPRAAELGMNISLFSRLCQAHPHAVSQLRLQYRMNADIMSLSNELIYGNQLRCGSEMVAKSSLDVPWLGQLPALFLEAKAQHPAKWARASEWAKEATGGASQQGGLGRHAGWLEVALLPKHKVVFLDTDGAPAHEKVLETSKGNVYNPIEATIAAQLLSWLAVGGVNPGRMAYLSPYRAQLKEVRSALPPSLKGIEALTVDKAQGRDFDFLVLTMVRSNETGAIGNLLSDWRRLNVAFSRAKQKLVVIGSRRTLQHSTILSSFLELIDRQGWCLELPPDVTDLYAMPPTASLSWFKNTWDRAGSRPVLATNVSFDRPITANLVHEIQQRPPNLVVPVEEATHLVQRESDW